MDLFGLIPIVPPSLPGERSSSLTAAQRFVAGCASGLLPAINFLVVLLVAIAAHPVIALAVMPLASATLVFLLCRRVARLSKYSGA
jgi:hypothetical protein